MAAGNSDHRAVDLGEQTSGKRERRRHDRGCELLGNP